MPDPAAAHPARRALTGWAAAVMACLGLIGPSWGPALVPARAAFGLGLAAAGTLFLVFGLARTAGSALAAALSDRAPRRRLVAAYGLVLVAALLAVALAPAWPAVLAGAAGIGFAFGAVSTEANALAAIAGGAGRARDLNLINAVYSTGAAVGPAVVGILLVTGHGWRLAFALWGAVAVMPFLGLARAAAASAPAAGPRRAPVRLAVDGRILALCGMAFVYNGVGWTVSGWAASYLVGRFGSTLLTGALGASVFYGCLAAGRVVNGGPLAAMGSGRLLRVEAGASGLALLALALAPSPVLALMAFGLAGLCLGGIYPNLIAFGTALAPGRPGAVSGLIATGGAIGVSIVPFAAGVLGQALGLDTLGWLLLVLGMGQFALSVLLVRGDRAAQGPQAQRG